MRDVLENITEQTGYTLAFSKEVVDLSERVTVRVTNTELDEVLNQLLTPREIGYELRDNKIYIFELSTAMLAEATRDDQQGTRISGRVTNSDGEPIPGTNVSIPGTAIGTVTDYDGQYALLVPKGSTLRFSFIGYIDREFLIVNQTVLNVQLVEDFAMLDELVVVGYGVQRKSVVTAAISRVTADELNVTRPSRGGCAQGESLRGADNPKLGTTGIRLQGAYPRIGTVNNSDPLYIVDGMEVGGGINYLNPVDIESVEILKDAASAAIYGARAANGVILVTTKGVAKERPRSTTM